jgi:HEPN domain-containing protein
MIGQSRRRPRCRQHRGQRPVRLNWAVCFHAQQATEKALTAVLVAYGIDFPRSHALERPIAPMPAEAASAFDFEAVAGRYPEDIPSPDLATTRRLIDTAQTVLHDAATVITGFSPHTAAEE